jgi:hypothetical protein
VITVSVLAGIYLGGVLLSLFVGFLDLQAGRFWAESSREAKWEILRHKWARESAEEFRKGRRKVRRCLLWPVDLLSYAPKYLWALWRESGAL